MSPPDEPGASPLRQVVALPAVRAYMASRFFSGLGRSLLSATLAWHVWKLTESYFMLGVVGLIEFLPVIPVSLYAGAFADAHDRRKIVLATQALSLLGALVLARAADGPSLELERAVVLGAAFALAFATSFENPAGTSILPSLVPRPLFASATVVLANARNVASVSGPVLMGAITSGFGIPAAYAVTAGCLVVSMLLLARVRVPLVPTLLRRAVSLDSIREGIAFVRAQPVIFGSMALDMFAVIFAGATAMLPVYADEILGVGELGYGLLSASMQLGTMAMAALLLVMRPIERPGRALLLSVLVFGAATIVFGLSRAFPLSLAAFVVAGMADQVSMVTRSVMLQLSTPDELRGRVNSVNMIFIGASNQLGAAESGFLATLTSATFSVVGGGVACLAVLFAVDRWAPEIRSYRVG